MADKLRVVVFTSIEMEDGDWAGPTPQGELLTYKSTNATASLKAVRDGTVVFDQDYGDKKVIYIDGNVLHLPEGAGPEI